MARIILYERDGSTHDWSEAQRVYEDESSTSVVARCEDDLEPCDPLDDLNVTPALEKPSVCCWDVDRIEFEFDTHTLKLWRSDHVDYFGSSVDKPRDCHAIVDWSDGTQTEYIHPDWWYDASSPFMTISDSNVCLWNVKKLTIKYEWEGPVSHPMEIAYPGEFPVYVIETAEQAAVCLRIVRSFAKEGARENSTYTAAISGLHRWIRGRMAIELELSGTPFLQWASEEAWPSAEARDKHSVIQAIPRARNLMEIKVRDGRPGYVIRTAEDALECLRMVDAFAKEAPPDSIYVAAISGLGRWAREWPAKEAALYVDEIDEEPWDDWDDTNAIPLPSDDWYDGDADYRAWKFWWEWSDDLQT